jgi:DNA-binding MarR family transcriptional regulator
MVIVLGIFSCLTAFTQQVASQFTTTRVQLDPGRVKGYVKNLIDSYNVWVDEYDKPRRDFVDIKAYFSLYLETGNSFRVIIVQTSPYQDQISLIFTRIRGDQLDVIVDYNDTLDTLFHYNNIRIGYTVTQKDIPFTYNGTVVRQDFVLGIKAADISGDYMTNSYNAAQSIYQGDQSQVPTVSQTTTVVQTSVSVISQATSVETSQNPFGTIPASSWVIGIIGAVVAILVIYFGGLREVVKLADEKERKRAIEELRQLFRVLLRRNKTEASLQNVSEINQKILVTLLRKGPLLTVQLIKEMGSTPTETLFLMKRLEKAGLVVSTHSISGQYWSVTTKGKDLFKLKI